MRLWWIPLVAFVFACGGGADKSPASADAAASWDGGALTLADLESAFAEARTPACRAARRSGGGLEDLVPCYRELAEGLALESLVLAEVEDVDAAVAGLEGYGELRRGTYLAAYQRRMLEETEVADEDVAAHFEADRERYRRPAQLQLWNIFRRHEDPARPEVTQAFLAGLKERFLAGETFEALAREYSHSETRLRGGQVGAVREGRLPRHLEDIAFALDDGAVSDPVAVAGGGVLLHVKNVVAGGDASLEEARGRIRRELRTRRIDAVISERVEDREPPPGSVLLTADELIEALDGGEAELVVQDIGGDRLSVAQMRQLAGLGASARADDLDAEGRDRLAELYHRQRERRLLALELLDSAADELRQEAEDALLRAAVAALVDERLQREMASPDAVDAETLRSYFEDNRSHYQSPLRFRLEVWDLPFGAAPPRQLARMEALGERLAAGELTLEAAVGELGGTVSDLGWRDFDELGDKIPAKARQYLLQAAEGGYSVPYQQDDAIHMIRIAERQEPRQLEYGDAAERVRADYLERFQQELYRRFAEARLDAVSFVCDEDHLRGMLAPEELGG